MIEDISYLKRQVNILGTEKEKSQECCKQLDKMILSKTFESMLSNETFGAKENESAGAHIYNSQIAQSFAHYFVESGMGFAKYIK